jgi:phospholipid/cholesterol/gamma-HCH transport system ATP-binding protein
MDASPLIQFIKVSKCFGETIVLREVNLSIYRGEITTVIGKSGVGKSVLLKHIVGLLQHDSGQILIEGRALGAMTKRQRREFKQRISYMFQGNALFDSLTVYENIALPLAETSALKTAVIRQRVLTKLEQLELTGLEQKYPSQLSGGMKKRVALARALVTEPQIVLFDEPTTGLDPIRKNGVHAMIADYQKTFGFTGVIVSHEIPDVFQISQRVAMLDEGRILFEGTPSALMAMPDDTIQRFIQGLAGEGQRQLALAREPSAAPTVGGRLQA